MTGISFFIGSAAICALPPLIGFSSKWSIYQALFKSAFGLPVIFDRAICLTTIGVLSGVGALAIACFAKAIGVAFLGKPRSNRASNAREVPLSMLAPQILLAAACLFMGVGVQWLVWPLTPMLLVVGKEPPLDIFAAIPLSQVALIVVSFLFAIYLLVLRRAPVSFKTWDCGFSKGSVKSQVTSDSFAQPIARIFTPVLRYHLSVDISGRDRRHFPEKIVVEPSIVSLLETRVYGPAAGLVNRLSQIVAKLQAGSIHLYLTYVCIALIVLMVVGTRL
jgi:hydrogenase-4 component B